ncbi:MAG: hypothetical protein ABSH51_22675 [Solirubrobacteraceae bacterium]|jgi:hypothetical protein
MNGETGGATLQRVNLNLRDAAYGRPDGLVGPTDGMRDRAPEFVAALTPVRMALSDVERDLIYRFRYRVYVEVLGRGYGNPDPIRRTFSDEEDVQPHVVIRHRCPGAG